MKKSLLIFLFFLAWIARQSNAEPGNMRKNIMVLLFNNQVDTTILVDYNLDFTYPAKYIALSLNGNSKINVLSDDTNFRYNPATIPQLFGLLDVGAIVTGNITAEITARRLIVQPKVYFSEKNANGILVIDSADMPEQSRGYYFTDELQKAVVNDLQTFFNTSITDNGEWNPAIFHSSGLSADELYKQSDSLLKANNISLAKTMAQLITQSKGSEWLGYRQLGKIELEQNNNDAAINYFDRALEVKNNDVISIGGKGTALLKKGLYPEALTEFRKCSKDAGKVEKLHHNMALCYFQLKNDSIIIEANYALKFEKDSAEIYNLLGRYFKEVKQSMLDSSIFYFQKAVLLNDSDVYVDNLNAACNQKGSELLLQNKFRESLPYFLKIFKTDTTAELLDNIRYDYTQLGLYDSVDFFIEVGCNHLLYDRAEVYFAQAGYCRSVFDNNNNEQPSNIRKALHYLRLDEQTNGETHRVYGSRGSAYFALDMNDSAIYFFNKAILFFSYSLDSYMSLAEVLIMSGWADSAYSAIKKGLDRIYDTPFYRNKLEVDDETVARFLMIVSKIILNRDYSGEQQEVNTFLDPFRKLGETEKQFITHWSFIKFQKWLAVSSIDPVAKEKINQQLNALKEFTDPKLFLSQ